MVKPNIKIIYLLNIVFSVFFSVLIIPKLPWLRDNLVTTAVVTMVITAFTTRMMIWLLSIIR